MKSAIETSGRRVAAAAPCARSAPAPHASAGEPSRVKTVDIFTCREVMRIRQGVEPANEVDAADEYFWAELLKGCAEADVFEAVWDHYRRHARRLWPADVLLWVRREGSRRRDAGLQAWREGRGLRQAMGWDASLLARWDEVYQTETGRGAPHSAALAVADWATEVLE